jgi:hypothetical protein
VSTSLRNVCSTLDGFKGVAETTCALKTATEALSSMSSMVAGILQNKGATGSTPNQKSNFDLSTAFQATYRTATQIMFLYFLNALLNSSRVRHCSNRVSFGADNSTVSPSEKIVRVCGTSFLE